jgi:hypothetical protein
VSLRLNLTSTAEQRGILSHSLVGFDATVGLTLSLELDSLTRLTGLRVLEPTINVSPHVDVFTGDPVADFLLAPARAIGNAVLTAVTQGCMEPIKRRLRSLFDLGHGLVSPPAIPAGVLDVIGEIAPAGVELDDLTMFGVAQTPTIPWRSPPVTPIPKATNRIHLPPDEEIPP